MNLKWLSVLACVVAVAGISNLRAADAAKHAGSMAQVILDHADELGLTADQKAKLEEMAKMPSPLTILTEEQRKKVREFQQTARGARPERKPATKLAETKPEGDKKDDKTETK